MNPLLTKYTFLFIIIFCISLILPKLSTVNAIKARSKPTTTTVAKTTTQNTGFVSAKLSRATNSVIFSLFNLNNYKAVNYSLSYTQSGKEEGIGGSINLTGQSTDKRDLYFGTCSSGVCTAHRNIKNAKLVITATLKNGKTTTKVYKIKY